MQCTLYDAYMMFHIVEHLQTASAKSSVRTSFTQLHISSQHTLHNRVCCAFSVFIGRVVSSSISVILLPQGTSLRKRCCATDSYCCCTATAAIATAAICCRCWWLTKL